MKILNNMFYILEIIQIIQYNQHNSVRRWKLVLIIWYITFFIVHCTIFIFVQCSTYSYLSKITGMVFVEIDSMMMHTTGVTTTTWVLSMLAWKIQTNLQKKQKYLRQYIFNINQIINFFLINPKNISQPRDRSLRYTYPRGRGHGSHVHVAFLSSFYV